MSAMNTDAGKPQGEHADAPNVAVRKSRASQDPHADIVAWANSDPHRNKEPAHPWPFKDEVISEAYSGVRCECVLTGCRAGPGCPHYCEHCKQHIAAIAKSEGKS